MYDSFQRDINYLRVSVTDRCNLRCVYCMPPEGVKQLSHEEVLTIEEINQIINAAAGIGINKIRLTGGEPTVRKGIYKLISCIAKNNNIKDISMTTNGTLLKQIGERLKNSGLDRVNISLDTLKPDRFKKITRVGNFQDAWNGIETALRLGLTPVKINCVIVRGINDDEIIDLAKLAMDYPLHVRFIELMPIGESDEWAMEKFVPAGEIIARIEESFGNTKPSKKVRGAGPARYYTIPGAAGSIGIISAISDHFCFQCNRLRLTATGGIRPCLLSDREIDIRSPLRNGASYLELQKIFARAVEMKPRKHGISDKCDDHMKLMSQIGG
ncbi:MAG: GTP 3',8-cyclase MoaA [Clostridiales bacterium]|nr:GTP 3',8-cyclase MoaA [Clostridiales bacterium]MCF8021472.1 GTP 3',8-cyclase MoaA [Clostridiales bacterium]